MREFLTIPDLEPGTAYQVQVHSVRNQIESFPITRVVSTSKRKLCTGICSFYFDTSIFTLIMFLLLFFFIFASTMLHILPTN